MRLTIRAGEVCAGDRLIVPDGEIEVIGPMVSQRDRHLVWLTTRHARHVDERVVVERPDPPITITVQLTAEEALEYARHMPAFSVTTLDPTLRVKAKVRAAIVAARAGETQ